MNSDDNKVLKPNKQSFVCMECEKTYALTEQFEDKPICLSCVTGSGLSSLLPETNVQEKITLAASVKADAVVSKKVKGSKGVDVEKLKIDDPDWVIISAGEFTMGSQDSELSRGADERLHTLQMTEFEIMTCPVTFEQYDVFCDATGREKLFDKGWGRDRYPVISVSYWDAVDYAVWLSEQTSWNCRLPTEAEWECSARAGTETAFNVGGKISCAQANYDGIYTYDGGSRGVSRWKTMPVKSFKRNAWGLFDMHGNVAEWCSSEYDSEYSGLEMMDASFDRMNNIPRSLRGGSWHSRPEFLRSACRYRFGPNESSAEWGFRLVRDV